MVGQRLVTSGDPRQDLLYNYGLVGANIDWRTYICLMKPQTLDDKGNHNTTTFPLLVCFISFHAHTLTVEHVYVFPLNYYDEVIHITQGGANYFVNAV